MGRGYCQNSRHCERVVITAYRDLRSRDVPDVSAFQACVTLYRIHHPEASVSEARRLVSEWIDHYVSRQREREGVRETADCA